MKRIRCVMLLAWVVLTASGCALLQLPFQLLQMAWNLAKHVPIPPPWMF